MDKSEKKSILIVVLALVVILLGTCEVTDHLNKNRNIPQTDTLAHSLYRAEKQHEIDLYRDKIARLQQQKDSLWFLVDVKKKAFFSTRPKVKLYQSRLEEQLSKPDSVCLDRDTIKRLADSLIVYQQHADTACVETIHSLEQVVANRDSSISIQKLVETNLKDIQRQQDLKAQYLTEQLNTALKAQRKKARQNKLLSGGILLLSGITTAVLLPQYLK